MVLKMTTVCSRLFL